MPQRDKLELVIEQLEERIAPGVTGKVHGNNGFGNGGGDGIPGGSDPAGGDLLR
jgi:hypothetical protein